MTRNEAQVAYVGKFNAFPCLTWGGRHIPEGMLVSLLSDAVKNNTPIDEEEGNRVEHELWPDIFNADGSTKDGIDI